MKIKKKKTNWWETTAEAERTKRNKELRLVFVLSLLFLILTFVEFRLFDLSETLPFVHSIFFFGLVNFNIILFLTLIFMIFRNVVKLYTEREKGIFGATLKGKLIMAFMAFSTIPTILMFLISLIYLNHSFNRWFGEKITAVLKSSLETTNEYYLSEKNRNYHFANEIVKNIKTLKSKKNLKKEIVNLRERFDLDIVQYYQGQREFFSVNNKALDLPKKIQLSSSFLAKGLEKKVEASEVVSTNQGQFVRVIVPLINHNASDEKSTYQNEALIVTSFIGLPIVSKVDEIAQVYLDLKNLNPLEYPIKSIYLNILIVITLTILLFASWFGFYLARQLAIPLQVLGEATKDISKRDYKYISYQSGSKEINSLIENFNVMSKELQKSEIELQQTNKTLKSTLLSLDRHTKYIEVVLENATTGVVSVDETGVITMMNSYAQALLGISGHFVGRKAKEVFPKPYFDAFNGLLKAMSQFSISHIKKEVRIQTEGRKLPYQVSVSVLLDEFKNEIGKVIVFDDLTTLIKAQKAAAWAEVASQLAHEIKNPLTPIKLSAERLKKKFSQKISDKSFLECTNMIIDQAEGLKDLVNEFGHFARLPLAKPRLAHMNALIIEVIQVYQSLQPKNKPKGSISYHFHQDEELPEFYFDYEQIKRVMINLIENAMDAVSGRANPQIEVSTEYNPSHQTVKIHIKDNGSGFSQGMESKIFEPYMTTKTNGTGLGLAIVKRTIEDHNGMVKAMNHSKGGAHFIIELPTEGEIRIADMKDPLGTENNLGVSDLSDQEMV